jgi:alpha-ketoglutarate-dependent taurine dioxygenase
MSDALRKLEENGWTTMALPRDADLREVVPLIRRELGDAARRIGIERVSPKRSEQARAGTLSALHGLAAFPLHTERAHWERPPRYVAFRSVGASSDRPTTLFDSYRLDPALVQRLRETVWTAGWNGVRFETRVLTPADALRWRIRYDLCCMAVTRPQDLELRDRVETELRHAEMHAHQWTPGVALLVDNWRVLHGRGTSPLPDYDRVLERIVIP